jgi:hypothetical protein
MSQCILRTFTITRTREPFKMQDIIPSPRSIMLITIHAVIMGMWLVPIASTFGMTRFYVPDPPAETLLYTATLILVLGTAVILAVRKIRNRVMIKGNPV